jgi:antitoxin (DNA-binding transcriptional repressor) of toxin-antitoxin stability system
MPTVNMHEAKTGMSKLVAEIESGAEQEIVIARNGKPVAKIVPLEPVELVPRRLGLAEGLYPPLDFDAFQALDKVIWAEALEEPIEPSAKTSSTKRRKSA